MRCRRNPGQCPPGPALSRQRERRQAASCSKRSVTGALRHATRRNGAHGAPSRAENRRKFFKPTAGGAEVSEPRGRSTPSAGSVAPSITGVSRGRQPLLGAGFPACRAPHVPDAPLSTEGPDAPPRARTEGVPDCGCHHRQRVRVVRFQADCATRHGLGFCGAQPTLRLTIAAHPFVKSDWLTKIKARGAIEMRRWR
jgi:hypothetical protein